MVLVGQWLELLDRVGLGVLQVAHGTRAPHSQMMGDSRACVRRPLGHGRCSGGTRDWQTGQDSGLSDTESSLQDHHPVGQHRLPGVEVTMAKTS